MTDIRVLTYGEYANKRWFKPTDFRFAASDRTVPIGFSEVPQAMLSLPLGFIKVEQSYQTVIVQGLLQGQNLLIDANGRWLADYLPLLYRAYPFRLAKNPEGQYVVCADHDSGLVTDAPAGHQFFEEEKNLGKEAGAMASLLMQFETERPHMANVCQLLSDNELIEPWPIQVQQSDGVIVVEALYRVNEKRLMELSVDALAAVRGCGGLMLCYAQLLSMAHLKQLATAAQRTHWANKAAVPAQKVAPLNIVDDNGILSFANM